MIRRAEAEGKSLGIEIPQPCHQGSLAWKGFWSLSSSRQSIGGMGGQIFGISYESLDRWLRNHVPPEERRLTERWIQELDDVYMRHHSAEVSRKAAKAKMKGKGGRVF